MNYKFKKLSENQKLIYDNLRMDGLGQLTATVLALRNYNKTNKLIHYSLLHDIDNAVNYLFNAIMNNKKMCVVADYDVDGATSCSIMVKGLKLLGADINYFVPNRFIHGYGLQPSVIDDMLNYFSNEKIETIITVDNGIASIEGVNYANSKNIDVLVTDHHLEGDERPNAVCIVNPNKKDCTFPSKALAGCGVAFYIIKALKDKFINFNIDENTEVYNPKQIEIIQKSKKTDISILLDYLAIGTIADVVSLDDNNRLIVQIGLNKIHKGECSTGVKAIMDALNLEQSKLNTMDIAFKIAPMLNAAGRIEDMSKGINLLLCNNYQNAYELALELIEINKKRKSIEKNMKENALKQLDMQNMNKLENDDNENMFSCVVYDDEFHEGVIGILASRIKDMFYVPTIVFSKVENTNQLKGSGRSIESIHLRDALDYVYKKYPDCIIKFGGHSMAAGLTINADKLDELKEGLNNYCKMILDNKKPTQIIEVDLEIDLSDVKLKDIEELNKQIWGQNFREPIFFGRFKIIEQKVLKDAHLKLTLEKDGEKIEAMQFFNNIPYPLNNNGSSAYTYLNAIFKFSINEFRGYKKIQIFIENAEIDF